MLLHTHSEGKEEYLYAVQEPKVREKICHLLANQRLVAKATGSCSNLCISNGLKVQR